MDENEQKKNPLVILGLIALIVVLVLGVEGIFVGLEHMLPAPKQSQAQSIEVDQSVQADVSTQGAETDLPAPGFCPHCGEKLPESFQWGQYCPYCGEKVE